jgi:regulator of replication initiation timing
MKEREIEQQFKMLQQEIALVGEQLEGLKRIQRAETDALRLEVETLRRCLEHLSPDFEECFGAVRTGVIQGTDPETLFCPSLILPLGYI